MAKINKPFKINRKIEVKNFYGFTLIELLIVSFLIGLLIMISIPFYEREKKIAKRTALIGDIRNCLADLAYQRQYYYPPPDPALIIQQCPKSQYTASLELVSTDPIVVKATTYGEEMSCTYDESQGSIICESPF